tara:strand:- start:628 stop:1092 length:465 start_codon:yes stop_codon:yes gene_type:complete
LSQVQYSEITKDDGKALVELGALMHSESSYSGLSFNPSRVLETFAWYLDDVHRTCFLAKRDGKPVGLYAGYIAKYYFSDEYVANDIAWFVVKELRGTRTGLRLLDLFENWATENGASEVRVGYSTDINPKAFNSLMKKRGYNLVGGNYRLEKAK